MFRGLLLRIIRAMLPDWSDLESVKGFFVWIYDLIQPLLPDWATLFPDWEDAEAVRRWVLEELIAPLNTLADLTNTQIDDAMVAGLERFASNQELWMMFYGLVIDLLDGEEGALPGEGNPRINRLADEAEMDPATIIMIISAVIQLIQMWRNRK